MLQLVIVDSFTWTIYVPCQVKTARVLWNQMVPRCLTSCLIETIDMFKLVAGMQFHADFRRVCEIKVS